MKTSALLSMALLLLLVSVVPTTSSDQTPITIKVTNAVTNSPNKTYSTQVAFRGILIGALRRLQESSPCFTFTYSEHPDYGPFLESVNGLAGNFSERTYWELLVKKTNNHTIRPDVGIGCYIPNANEQIILKYNKY
ncbi:Gastric intrinsic factor [Collichthys lucidus]|uniref:Gastric intrinsic factor n=1 Tax=Collichthys lucidus TaxID=240159 RepID=A0A4U5VJS9_COLLU|nr:Gastric intrinsic factor [Collichthys lucidus]